MDPDPVAKETQIMENIFSLPKALHFLKFYFYPKLTKFNKKHAFNAKDIEFDTNSQF